jgi:hypothetical protein
MQEPALARAPRHFVRMTCRSSIHKVIHSIHKVIHFCDLLLYMLAIELAINYMSTIANSWLYYYSCSQWKRAHVVAA